MEKYTVFIDNKAKKFIKKHKKDKITLDMINNKLKEIIKNPYNTEYIFINTSKCPKCKRAKKGDYRIIFYVSSKKNYIEFIDIFDRRTDYRNY